MKKQIHEITRLQKLAGIKPLTEGIESRRKEVEELRPNLEDDIQEFWETSKYNSEPLWDTETFIGVYPEWEGFEDDINGIVQELGYPIY